MLRRIWNALRCLVAAIVTAFREEILGQRSVVKSVFFDSELRSTLFDSEPASPALKIKDWVIPFEVSGNKGEVRYAQANSFCLFRGERLVAVDDSFDPGHGTVIERIEVGMKPQMTPVPYGGPVPTYTFGEGSVGSGSKYQTCQIGETILYQVRFLETCTWHGALFGSAVH